VRAVFSLLGLPVLLALAGAARAREPAAATRAFVEVTTPRPEVYVHEPVPLRLRVGFDRAFFEAHAVPLFRQAMDVPVQVRASWIHALEGTTALPVPETAGGPTLSFALQDGVVRGRRVADVVRDGVPFTVIEVERRYLPERPGTLAVPAPSLRFAHATRFEEDFLGGRVALDREDVRVEGRPLVVEVRPLPEAGRPGEFVDAVGRFTLDASVARANGGARPLYRLTLVIRGEGNLATLTPPGPDRLPGFHVYGTIDDEGDPVRKVVHEIGPLDGVTTVPSVPFAFFDPLPPAGYHVVRTPPLALGGGVPGAPAPASPRPAPADHGDAGWVLVWLAVGLLLVALLATILGGRRRRPPTDEVADLAAQRARRATDAVRACAGEPDGELAHAYAEYLAAHLRLPTAAVIAPDLPVRLVAAGVPVELAADAADALERLVAARYGGRGFDEASSRIARLVDRLDAAFHPATQPL